MSSLKSLFIVYDADGTVCGEIIYHIKKTFFNGKCSACDITHGPKQEKPEFTQLKGDFQVPVHNIHRDEMHVELRASARRLPCVVAEMSDGYYDVLLNPEELELANGSVESLNKLVRQKLELKGFAPTLSDGDMYQLEEEEDDRRVPTM